jgi:hypothetical protein
VSNRFGFGIDNSISKKTLEQMEAAALIILLAYLQREDDASLFKILGTECDDIDKEEIKKIPTIGRIEKNRICML